MIFCFLLKLMKYQKICVIKIKIRLALLNCVYHKKLKFLRNTSDDLALTFAPYLFRISNHFPSSKLTDIVSKHFVLYPKSPRIQ